MSVHFHVDSRAADAALAALADDKRAKAIRLATTAGAKAAVPILRGRTPVGPTGNLRASVQAKAMKKRYGIGSVVAPMTKKGRASRATGVRGAGTSAQHRQFVILGTKRHAIHGRSGGFLRIGNRYLQAVDHPGAKANPFVDRAAGAMASASEGAFMHRLSRYLESGRIPSG